MDKLIKVYVYDIHKLKDEEIDKYKLELDSSRVKKIDKKKSIIDKKLSLAAGLALKEGLEKEGYDYKKLVFGNLDDGKGVIINKSNIHYNISHSGEYAVCAIASCDIGVDIQRVDKVNDKIIDRCFTEYEANYVREYDDDMLQYRFTKVWSIKESVLKAQGCGIKQNLKNVKSHNLDSNMQHVDFYMGETIKKCYVNSFDIIAGYVISVCTFERIDDTQIYFVN